MFDPSAYEELRSLIGSDLPEDYLNFMKSYDGTVPAKDFYWVVPDDWGSGIDR